MQSKNISVDDEILILRYIYRELSPEEESAFQLRLEKEHDLSERCFDLINTIQLLEEVQEEPFEETILTILNFSKNFKG
ncbi:MAG: hypothetical protein NZM38_10430 [Cytophagales bacterium]|nr:hypothetical protein [Cytophagales bacterium]MDW8385170.1 hypothetical protein [Flammeovirgaceae bacterium]